MRSLTHPLPSRSSCTPKEWTANEVDADAATFKLDRTGVMAVACRHGHVLAGLWMRTGERHVYMHLLLAHLVGVTPPPPDPSPA